MNMLRCCLNPKVLAGLAVASVGVYVVSPGAVLSALPFLFMVVCPLSMLLMMRAMGGMQGGRAVAQYACPMHPDSQAATPGRCTTCGLQMVPATAHVTAHATLGQQPVSAVVPPATGRDEQLALLRAQLNGLDERQAELSGQITALENVRADQPTAQGRMDLEAEPVARAGR